MKKFLLLLLFIAPTFGVLSAQHCSDDEKAILHDIWLGFNSTESVNWDFDDTTLVLNNTWDGITMTADGCNILMIDLGGVLFGGTISSAIGSLDSLVELDLSSNFLTGPMPSEINDLVNLKDLHLQINQLTGGIPDFSNLSNLESILLYGNGITGGIPLSLTTLPNLKYLYLNNNNLSGPIPPELINLANLHHLNLSQNNFSGTLSPLLANFVCIQSLVLSDNDLEGCIPSSFYVYCPPYNVNLSGNESMVNDSMPSFCSEGFGVCDDDVDGDGIPFVIDNCPTVANSDQADLDEDGEGDVCDDDIDGDTVLNDVDCAPYDANITTQIGETCDDGDPLTTNDIIQPGCTCVGDIPDTDGDGIVDTEDNCIEIINPDQMDMDNDGEGDVCDDDIDGDGVINVIDCDSLDATIFQGASCNDGNSSTVIDIINDDCICAGVELSVCTVGDKNTLYTIYQALGSPTNLNWDFSPGILLDDSWDGIQMTNEGCNILRIELANRDLTGTLSPALGDLEFLKVLDLSINNITGNIPVSLTELNNLENLRLQVNDLSGDLLPEIGNISTLKFLWLFGNDFTGEIPTSFGNLTDLRNLLLQNNQLTGGIPDEIGNLTLLRRLYLSDNMMTGAMPDTLASLDHLTHLYLNDNSFEPCVPSSYHNFCDPVIIWFDTIAIDTVDMVIDLSGNNFDYDNFDNFCTNGFGECGNMMLLQFDVMVYLEGPLLNDVTFEMNDHIRTEESFPLTEPYTSLGYNQVNGGGEMTNTNVLSVEGDGAIVDWVFIELRDGINQDVILETKSALLRKDGGIVASFDGVSPITFQNQSLLTNEIVVVVKHRNHLGISNINPYTINAIEELIVLDFTDPEFAIVGGDLGMGLIGDKRVMFSGDANQDGSINAVDKNGYWRNENGSFFNYFDLQSDFNLDGVVNPVDKNSLWRTNNGTSGQVEN